MRCAGGLPALPMPGSLGVGAVCPGRGAVAGDCDASASDNNVSAENAMAYGCQNWSSGKGRTWHSICSTARRKPSCLIGVLRAGLGRLNGHSAMRRSGSIDNCPARGYCRHEQDRSHPRRRDRTEVINEGVKVLTEAARKFRVSISFTSFDWGARYLKTGETLLKAPSRRSRILMQSTWEHRESRLKPASLTGHLCGFASSLTSTSTSGPSAVPQR